MPLHSILSPVRTCLQAIEVWKIRGLANRIIARSGELATAADSELTIAARRMHWEAQTGVSSKTLLLEAFALVRETSRRVLGMAHFPVQVMGGIVLQAGHIAEMQTGEGKTLTAVLPIFLQSLAGLGCHVVTSNDYLAERDVTLLRPLYERLGLTVGLVVAKSTPGERRDAYASDITYGTAQEMGFDFLRDRMQQPAGSWSTDGESLGTESRAVQRGHHFVLIDEVDSILVDEGKTPLVIGMVTPNDAATVSLYRWSRRSIPDLVRERDFSYEPQHRRAQLTAAGCRKVLLQPKTTLLESINSERFFGAVENALTAELGFQRDRDYLVAKGEVRIVDGSTGRVMEGRKWEQGLHQSIEAKEYLPISPATGEAARLTMQSYFRLYTQVAGMSGTARPARQEFKQVYKRRVIVIPTHRRCLRRKLATRIFATIESKRLAIVDEIAIRHATGQPLLIGTPSVAASVALGDLLAVRNLPFLLLNANEHERESELIRLAGEVGQITIATNMAGRGTDIQVGEDVQLLGGLHVISTEMHMSSRIDQQFIGRTARQGDVGSYQFFLSLEDELLLCLEPEVLSSQRRRARPDLHGEICVDSWLPFYQRTQRFLERLHAKQRHALLKQEKQRVTTYRRMGLDPFLELTEVYQ